MPTKRFFINAIGSSYAEEIYRDENDEHTATYSIPANPSGTPEIDVLKNISTSSYLYTVGGGYYSSTVNGFISAAFDYDSILKEIGDKKIKSCTFAMGNNKATNGGITFYFKNINFFGSGDQLENLSSVKLTENPETKAPWTVQDFYSEYSNNVDITINAFSDSPIKLYYVYVDIEYESHEMLNTPLGKIKMNSSKGVISIPYFDPSLLAYPALKINTSKGIGAFCLVDSSDPYASPIKINTSKGIKSIGYIK